MRFQAALPEPNGSTQLGNVVPSLFLTWGEARDVARPFTAGSNTVMPSPVLAVLNGAETLDIFEDVQEVYAEAFPGYDLADHRARTVRQATSAGFTTVTARIDEVLSGFAYGLPLTSRTTWWTGLRPERPAEFVAETGERTFAVIDLAVRPTARGQGLGRLLMDTLLGARPEVRATLASAPHKLENKRMYEAWGWQVVGQVPGGPGTTQPVYDLYLKALP